MNNEFKRMMELAGLNEIKINEPNRFIKLNLPFDPTDRVRISIDDINHEYDNLMDNIVAANPQIDPKFFRIHYNYISNDIMDTIYDDYNGEVTIPEFYKIYFVWLWANLVSDLDKFTWEEVNQRQLKYNHMSDEFVDGAMNGKWLVVPDVTA